MCIILTNEGHGACVTQTMLARPRLRKRVLGESRYTLGQPSDAGKKSVGQCKVVQAEELRLSV